MRAPRADNKEDFHSDLYDIKMKSAQPVSQLFQKDNYLSRWSTSLHCSWVDKLCYLHNP